MKIGGAGDASRYREQFEQWEFRGYKHLEKIVHDWAGGSDKLDDENKDIYHVVLYYAVSRFTTNYHYLFLVISSVFAFFMLKSLKFLTNEMNGKLTWVAFILLFLFVQNNIFNINGFRFWTAAWIGIYCIFQIFRNNRPIYLLLLPIAFCVHTSYMIFGVITVAIYLFKRVFHYTHTFWVTIFVISIFVGNLLLNFFNQEMVSYLPANFAKYTKIFDPDFMEGRQLYKSENWNYLHLLWDNIRYYYINILVFVLARNVYTICNDKRSYYLYIFLLIFTIVCNLGQIIYTFGNRFVFLTYSIIAYLWWVTFGTKKYRWIIYLLPIAFLYEVWTNIDRWYSCTEAWFYIGNPIVNIVHYLF
jgi:hypothetical protein